MKHDTVMLAVAALLISASSAQAQTLGWYGAVDIVGHHVPGMDTDVSAASDPVLKSRQGFHFRVIEDYYGAFARIGYRLTPHIRLEVEGGYRPAPLNSLEDVAKQGVPSSVHLCAAPGLSGACVEPPGSLDAYTGMANALYDFSPIWRFTPFVGAGLGMNRLAVRAKGVLAGSALAIPEAASIDSNTTSFAYQGIAGVAYQASRRLNVDLTFRYLTGLDTNIVLSDHATGQSATLTGRYSDFSLALGLRYAFR